MNPMVQAALAAIFRWLLTFGSAYLVSRGVWTQEDATTYVVAGAAALATLAWSLYQKYVERSKLVTALASPPTSEQHVEQMVKAGTGASVSTPKNETPTK